MKILWTSVVFYMCILLCGLAHVGLKIQEEKLFLFVSILLGWRLVK